MIFTLLYKHKIIMQNQYLVYANKKSPAKAGRVRLLINIINTKK